MQDLVLKVKNYIKTKNLINNNKVVLAFSYGVDSRVLLDILLKLNYEVVLAHVNHGVREESKLEEDETYKLAKKLNLAVYVKHLSLDNSNFEDSARDQRYNFFKEICLVENTNILVTAHHLDDNLETILLKYYQGSNLYGYSGIHPLVEKKGITIVRPLLCTTKDEIREYQKINKLLYFEDYTNSLNVQKRNRIRNIIIPKIKDEDSNILYKIKEYSEITSEAFNFIRKLSINYLNKWNNIIDLNEYINLDISLRKDIICLMLENNHINRSYKLICNIDKLLLNDKPQLEINLSNNFYFFKRYSKAYIGLLNNNSIETVSLNLNDLVHFGSYSFYFTKELRNDMKNYIKLCYNTLKLPLTIRVRQNGDKIKLSSGTKKVKDIFIDKKIDKELRDKLPLIINNDEIIWIPSIIKSDNIKDALINGDIYLVMEENIC